MKNLLIGIIFIFIGIGLNGQIKFEHLTTKDGLSTNRVGSIFRDSKGYLWIGSEVGLDKYDSYEIKTYRHNEIQPGTLSNNDIWEIFEDHNKNIWVATYDGLNLYCPESDSFLVFKNDPEDSTSIDHNRIFAFFHDTKENLWISTQGNCLNKWVPATKKFIRYPIINSSGFLFMNEDSKGNLWLVSEGFSGISRFDPKTGNLITYQDTSIDLTIKYKELYIDNDDKLWIAPRNEGLFSFDQSTGKFKQYSSNGDGKGINGKIINNIIEKDNRHLWIGVDQGGINCFDKVSQTFKYIMHNERNEDGLSNNGIWEVIKDNEGIIWIGTSGGGINFYNPQKEKFKLFRHNSDDPNSVSSNIIGSFYEDSQGMIWIGTDNNGLDVFNSETGNFKSFKHNPSDPYSISSNTIRCIGEDENKNLWIGTWNKGFNRYDRKTGRFYCYKPDANNQASLSGSTVWHYIIDHQGVFWLAIHDVGVDLFDKKKGVIKRFVPDANNPKALSNAKVWYIFEDSNRNIWLCTNDGLNLYDSIDNSFIVYKHFPSKNIKAITEDGDKNLWICSDNGICQIKVNGTLLQAYDETDGLAGNIVHGVVCDNSGNLWFSTNNGISKFDPKTKTFKNFTEKDGLQDNAFFQESFLKTRNGEIYFGGFNGFNSFYPDSIKLNTTIPPVYITEFQIFNKPVAWGIEGSPLKKHISETEEITLTHLQSVFSFGFTAINFTNPEKNLYAYKMEGFDAEESGWNYTDASRRYVTYTNLDPGEYTFRVKASNNDSVWNEKGTSIKIIILPPWWQTLWFRIIAACSIFFTVIGLFNYRIYHLRMQKLRLSKMVKERTIQLEEANTSLKERQEEIFHQNEELHIQKESLQEINKTLEEQKVEIESQRNELNQHRDHLEQLVKERTDELVTALKKAEESDQLKSAFLQNMSHEIRTPMNAIVGFSELLAYPDIPNTEKETLISLIEKSSEVLLTLVNDILDMSQIQSNQLVIQNEPVNVIEILKELLSFFQLQAQPKGIELFLESYTFDENIICLADPLRFKQILSNLISNALKFTEKGSIKFGVNNQVDGFVTFFVRDTGIGIPQEIGNSIFERFIKVEPTKTKLYGGVGLGLAICYNLINAMGGTIWYESDLGQGTTFYFTLRCNNVDQIERAATKNKHKKTEIPNLSDKQILIVEDDDTNYFLLELFLSKTKANLIWAKNGLEAVENVKKNNNIDLILMDLKMPVMDGIEATKLIKQIKPALIIVAQTAFAYKDEKDEFLKSGFDGYIEKPLILEKLMETINEAFKK